MDLNSLRGKRITVMGLGLHGGGVGTVRFLVSHGAKITVIDLKSKEELKPSIDKLKDLKNITYAFQQHRPEDFTNTDMVIKNPAVPWSNKYIKLALDRNIPVEMDSSLFFKLCPCKIIGITGSKGKTTTSNLIYETLKLASKKPVKVGIGQISVLDKLENLKKDNIVVFELSSWRLSALGRNKISPQISVITNIYPDHLNYYKTMEEYVNDKKNIFLYQKKEDSLILNIDSEEVQKFEPLAKSKVLKISKKKISESKGVYFDFGVIYYNNGIDEKKIIDVSEIKPRGEHNIYNVMATLAVAFELGINSEITKKAVSQFKEVEHRLEFVRELSGVRYINDSAATIPEAGIFALNSFQEPIILICGGSNKNLDMEKFGREIYRKAKGVVFLKGKATDRIILAMKKENPDLDTDKMKIVETMEKAVELAKSVSERGDLILLSPGAASFGNFKNEFDRGNAFKEEVLKLE